MVLNVDKIVDQLYNFQCCLSDRLTSYIEALQIQNCKEFNLKKIQEHNLYFGLVKREMLRLKNNDEPVNEDGIKTAVNKLKIYCKQCCD